MSKPYDPMLEMANRVAGLPWAMHQSLEGEGRRPAKIGGWTEAQWLAMGASPAGTASVFRAKEMADKVAASLFGTLARNRRPALRKALRDALLVDLPVTNEHRFEGILDRLCAAVEALEDRP